MSSVFCLRDVVRERLTAAAEDILRVFADRVAEYEEEIRRQRELLDVVLKPVVKLHQKQVAEGLADRPLCVQDRSSSQGPPGIKEEWEELPTSREGQETDTCLMGRTPLLDPPNVTSGAAIQSESDSDHGLPRRDQRSERFKCLFCAEEFSDLLKLKVHTRTHVGEKHYKCDTCGKGFALKARMRNHAGATPLNCPVCGKEFDCGANVKTHAGQKPHACLTCGKGFRRGADLRRHNRTHTGEKPYRCAHCGKGFSYASSLKNHVRVHTGEKPYKCVLCGKGFAVGTTLKIHTRVHTGEKPYACGVCGKRFAHGTGLRLHGRIHAHERLQSSNPKMY
nr:zinc finger protein 45-like [Gasterosteus aculeatus aculeatus]